MSFSNYNPPYLCEEDQEPKPDGSGDVAEGDQGDDEDNDDDEGDDAWVYEDDSSVSSGSSLPPDDYGDQ
ncbi:uncharacterized protein EHS24_007812 [Apiotrichum porosum]|uniref:Uncharacterized protein n=1 Tax=Apiotrichum porosum TaxID=105984 RepID=A0A427XS20_9TREE|nr:uncharacterized protein EHS24_007812 [Apiotrichum porosum]RSH81634.1 hypothetical protein EHS24_007812 [Apiotrichum porosum]